MLDNLHWLSILAGCVTYRKYLTRRSHERRVRKSAALQINRLQKHLFILWVFKIMHSQPVIDEINKLYPNGAAVPA